MQDSTFYSLIIIISENQVASFTKEVNPQLAKRPLKWAFS